ncbi:MAG: hypothetical protein PVF43_06720 [Candidatus Eiseniibacteriota bacterium]|jgi:hypothetical protein
MNEPLSAGCIDRRPGRRRAPGTVPTLLLALLTLGVAAGVARAQDPDAAADAAPDEDARPAGGIVISVDPDEPDEAARPDEAAQADDAGPSSDNDYQWEDDGDDWDTDWGEDLDLRGHRLDDEQLEDLQRQAERQLDRAQRELERLDRRGRRTPLPPLPPNEDLPQPRVPGRAPFEIDRDREQVVRIGRNLRVEQNEIVESAVVFFGNLIVEGEVEQDAVVIGGSLHLAEDGIIGGDAVVVGGDLDVDRYGFVRGESVEVGDLGPLNLAMIMAPHADRSSPARRLLSLFVALFLTLFFAWLAHLLIGDRLQVMSETLQAGFWRTFLIGLLISVLWLPAVVLFAITVIGIPVALLLVLATPLAIFLGFLVGAQTLGRRVAGGVRFERQSNLGYLMVGIIAIAALFLLGRMLGVVGDLLMPVAFGFATAGVLIGGLLSTAGFGALVSSRFGKNPPSEGGGEGGPGATPPLGPGTSPPATGTSLAPAAPPASPAAQPPASPAAQPPAPPAAQPPASPAAQPPAPPAAQPPASPTTPTPAPPAPPAASPPSTPPGPPPSPPPAAPDAPDAGDAPDSGDAPPR